MAQIAVGAANVFSRLKPWAVVLHVAFSVLIWATVVALATVAWGRARSGGSSDPEPVVDETGEAVGTPSARDTVTAYYRLTKPRIIVLLLITTVPAMMLAAGGMPSIWLILATLVGGSLAAGSANAINMYLDRDIDEVMRRTRQRPLPAHAVTPEQALALRLRAGRDLVPVPLDHRERARRDPRALGDRVLRLRVHDVAEALHRTEHRDRRGGGRGAGARRLGGRHRARSRRPPGSCSRSSSSGPRRTSGPWRCASAATTRRPACRCSRWSRATTRPDARSSCTRSRSSGRRCCCTRSASMGPIYLATAVGTRRGVRLPRARALASSERRRQLAALQVLDRVPRRPVRRGRARRAALAGWSAPSVKRRSALSGSRAPRRGGSTPRPRSSPRRSPTGSCPRRRRCTCRAGSGNPRSSA